MDMNKSVAGKNYGTNDGSYWVNKSIASCCNDAIAYERIPLSVLSSNINYPSFYDSI